MIEYRTDRVSPTKEENMMTLRTAFGWHFINASEIYNQSQRITGISARIYGSGEGIIGSFIDGLHTGGPDIEATVHGTTDMTNYVTLYFARDTSMPGYAQIKQLESHCFSCLTRIRAPKKPKLFASLLAAYILLMIAAAIGVFSSGDRPETIDLLLIIPFLIFFLGYLIQRSVYRKSVRYDDLLLDEIQECISQAREITES